MADDGSGDESREELDSTAPLHAGGVGLCLSGGGYRAMLFHLGALRRLNEVGRLAGGSYSETAHPHSDWLRGTLRVLNTVDVQVRRLRRREVVGALASGQRRGAFWAINTDPVRFSSRAPTLPVSTEQAKALASVGTRLAKTDTVLCHRIANWGYAAADSALRTYVDPSLPTPVGYPYPGGVAE